MTCDFLFSWRVMIAALIMLAFVAFTNYMMIFFSCRGLKEHGAWLNKNHSRDLWCIRILVSYLEIAWHRRLIHYMIKKDVFCFFLLSFTLIQVQNGLAVYATWTSIATLINLTIVVHYDAGMSESHAATLSLSLLSVAVLVW